MTNSKQWLTILIGASLVAVLLVTVFIGVPALAQGPGGGMMGGYGHGGGMMGYTQNISSTNTFGCPGFGQGMMGGQGYGMMAGMMGGMMRNSNSPFFTSPALTIAEASEAVKTYLTSLNNDKLELHEVMIFDNHAYAEIREKDTGNGAMELLVDPATKAVYPEMGPNMMWNLKYGMRSGNNGNGMMGMMGYANPTDPSAKMTVTPAEAVEAAQTYLNTNLPNNKLSVEQEAEPFYGYYTLHVSRDSQTVGMLSVNGYTQDVFLHTWHGKLLEMSEE